MSKFDSFHATAFDSFKQSPLQERMTDAAPAYTGLFCSGSTGNDPVLYLWQWSGTEWVKLTQRIGQNDLPIPAFHLESHNGYVYGISATGQGQTKHAFYWTGSQWVSAGAVPTDIEDRSSELHIWGLHEGDDGNLYSHIIETAPPGEYSFYLKHNGQSWIEVSRKTPYIGTSGILYVISQSNAYLAGFGVSRYTGSWSDIGPGAAWPFVAVLAIHYYGARPVIATTAAYGFVADYDGASWNAIGGGTNNVARKFVTYSGNLVVGGNFTSPAVRIASWNGAAWSALGSGVGFEVFALAVDSGSGNLIAGGVSGQIQQWNGASWSTMGNTMFTGVQSIASL